MQQYIKSHALLAGTDIRHLLTFALDSLEYDNNNNSNTDTDGLGGMERMGQEVW